MFQMKAYTIVILEKTMKLYMQFLGSTDQKQAFINHKLCGQYLSFSSVSISNKSLSAAGEHH